MSATRTKSDYWTDQQDLQDRIDALEQQLRSGAIASPGDIKMYAGKTAMPTGWILCDGSVYDIATYKDLDAVCGSAVEHPFNGGVSPGVGKFRVPDLRSRVPIAAGQGSSLTNRLLGASGGEENHTLTIAELAQHNHGVNDPTHAHSVYDPSHVHSISEAPAAMSNPQNGLFMGAGNPPVVSGGGTAAAATGIGIYAASTGVTIQNNGSSTAHNTMQPFLVVNFIIKF